MNLFEATITTPIEDIELELIGHPPIPWLDFWLNPLRLRGSDFLMRWSQGRWSEERIIEAINETDQYYALPYGPSGTAPDDPREYELYFERLEKAGLGKIKRPDLLLFKKSDENEITGIVQELGGVENLPFTQENDICIKAIISKAVIAVECENSLWVARKMPDYNAKLKPMRRLGGKPGLKKNPVLPSVWLKHEDRAPLYSWQGLHRVPIHIWQVFFDIAIGLALDRAEELITEGLIELSIQTFQAASGPTTTKGVYKIYHHYAYPVGVALEEPKLVAEHLEDKNGHILPYVKFEGGKLIISVEALQVLDAASFEGRT